MPEISLKQVCCTCLSTNRKLFKLCRVKDGVNLLYMLLTQNPDAYKEGFYKGMATLYVCWECNAMIYKIKRFRTQACLVQKQLTSIADGRKDVKLQSHSCLSMSQITKYHFEFQYNVTLENFIDCGPIEEVKSESDSDDVPLSVFCHENDYGYLEHGNNLIEQNNISVGTEIELDSECKKSTISDGKPNKSDKKFTRSAERSPSPDCEISIDSKNSAQIVKKKTEMKLQKYNKYFTVLNMDEVEMLRSIEDRKQDTNFKDAVYKCESCVLVFKDQNEIDTHLFEMHAKKDNYTECDICLSYVQNSSGHRQNHYKGYQCKICIAIFHTYFHIVTHLKECHKEVFIKEKECKRIRKAHKTNGRTVLNSYSCPECHMVFENKNVRWKHVQKEHREGYKCTACGKIFAFKNNFKRHERIHQGPQPREECPTCHKLIRTDLMKIHSRIHTDRQKYTCVECDKCFVSQATYENHLKFAQAHAIGEVCRHKCSMCHKSYRSGGELKDHINYHHKGKADHKCPICGKGLATKRCIRRHVRRAHEGVKENAKDKICQQCGKAFRDNKGLIEHERVHTGARPLRCAACGRAFRQRAALYAHARRLHKDMPRTT